MAKLRMGVVGCGNMTQEAHSKSLERLVNEGRDLEVTACCDVVKESADMIAAMFNAKSYTNYKDMVDDVDAVLIVTTHDVHYEIAKFFMENDKHILLEKPLCNTREEVVDLIETSERRGITFMCAYPVPYWEGVSLMKELLDSGKYGKITQMSIWTEQLSNHQGRATKENPIKKEILGGGQLFSHGCHYIDVLLWFLGNPVSGVHMGTNTNVEWMEGEGTSNVTMTFENGAMAYHFGTWGARGTTHGYTFHVHTDEGMFEYVDGSPAKLMFITNTHPDPYKKNKITTWQLGRTTGHATWAEIAHFMECIKDKKLPLTNGRRALRSLDTIWKLYEAEEKNEIADLRGI